MSNKQTSQKTDAPAVLVVEDEPFIRMCTVATLEDAGFRVVEAANSGEALDVLAQHDDISIVVTDVRMPGAMDGLGLVARVRTDRPAIRAVVVSGNTNPDDAYRAGAAAFIPKPYQPPSVVATVMRLIAQSQEQIGAVA